ncbi:acetate--CoA ligase [Desulfosarcina widdelii]|uniref:Acetate--CoA ligase n=1 Tax=Desulfosarcina widdelii TaxID=947919 RepID=A0A5K7Z805_9BACT|nr:acyl-CoA synthetase [Desulfosarcina widdelii]BBO72627.1 acetate--CoA ligase [Desulfosarcina widdelii]
MRMLEYETYEEAHKNFTWDQTWEIFDGSPENFNMAHECIDRHVGKGIALRIKFDDGHREEYSFDQVSKMSSQFAHALEVMGVKYQDKVAIMLDPCLEYYVSLFGTMKRGSIAVPCYSQFGPDALEYRLKDSGAKVLVTTEEVKKMPIDWSKTSVITVGQSFQRFTDGNPDRYETKTNAKDIAVYQYTSGTTKKYPDAVKHYHRSIVTLMPAAIFGRGFRLGDRYFCPSNPAWGHGLWHGTLSPLALGVAAGAYSGKFDIDVLLKGLEEFEIDNMGAAPTVYRLIKNSGLIGRHRLLIKKMHYTGEPMDTDTFQFFKDVFGVPPHSGYGSTEAGALIYQYAGFKDWNVKSGSLGKPMPGMEVTLLDEEGNEVPRGTIGEIALKRRGEWFRVKDAAVVDEDGYYWHKGRVDDVIISAGWTISPTEVEDALLKHPAVLESVVVGVPHADRGLIVKAFIVASQEPCEELKKEIQNFVKEKLSKHEYPREIQFMHSFPKTESGKIKKAELKKILSNN